MVKIEFHETVTHDRASDSRTFSRKSVAEFQGVPEVIGWGNAQGQKLSNDMFAARVSGRSMEPRIHDGDWCLFKRCPAGSRQGRLLLVQVNTHLDREDGGRYTISRYQSIKKNDEDGWP